MIATGYREGCCPLIEQTLARIEELQHAIAEAYVRWDALDSQTRS